MKKLGQRVTIKNEMGVMTEFIGARGSIIDSEQDGRTTMYRVRFDSPVIVQGLDPVTDDLFAGRYLRNVR